LTGTSAATAIHFTSETLSIMSILDDLKNKRVLVTGASTGIGAAVARGFGEHGAFVAVHYNASKADAEKVAADIKAKGGKAVLVGGDMSKSAQAAKVVTDAVAALGGLDVLVNNAGHYVVRAMFADFKDDDYDRIMGVNVRSILAATKAAHPHLKASGKASIINTGSIAGRNGGRLGSGLYAAAKAQVHSISKGMASEFAADGIRVNAVAPGVIVTPFHKETPKERLEQVKNSVPLKRLGESEDMVGVYLFLASNAMSGYITGQTFDVNGGQLMP
jgi:3-oxoacyl-[acyl-carrier protein] reductase